jgi:hypothetical protein
VGGQAAKAYVEAEVPKLVIPPVNNCQARWIHVSGHNQPGFGALVVFVPLSPYRPHWVLENNREVPYIRAGEHSYPMRLQTFRDILTRGEAGEAEIESLGIKERPRQYGASGWKCHLNPRVRLLSGPICPLWSVELTATKDVGWFETPPGDAVLAEPHIVILNGPQPLFLHRSTIVGRSNLVLFVRPEAAGTLLVKVVLSAGSAPPVERVFTWDDVFNGRA